MSFKSGPVVLGTTDTTIFECPATFSGAAVIGIANVGASARAYVLKFYRASTATTTTIANGVSITANSTVKYPIPISMEAGDKIIGLCSASATDVVVTPTITLGPSSAAKGLTPRGAYAAGTTYAKNDLVSDSGTSYISLTDSNIGNAPASSPASWMVNSAKGATGDTGASGTSALTVVRLVSTTATDPSTDYAAGLTIDGVALVQNDLLLRASTTNPELNGVYVVPASGAAARHASFTTFDSVCGVYFSVMEGTANADTLWKCTADRGGVIGTDALTIVSAIAVSSFPLNYISGLMLSNSASDATNDIDIAIGGAADSTNAQIMQLASALTKQLDAVWTVGTNAGGLDTGTVGDNTYHVFLIKRTDTGVVDSLFSLSPTAPTMPANYTLKRRIGSIVRSGGAIKGFVQDGDAFIWKGGPTLDVADVGVSIGTAAVTRTLTLPTGIRVRARLTCRISNNVSNEAVYLSDLSATDVAADLAQVYTISVPSGGALGAQVTVMSNTAAQIRSRMVVGDTNASLRIGVIGWDDARGV